MKRKPKPLTIKFHYVPNPGAVKRAYKIVFDEVYRKMKEKREI